MINDYGIIDFGWRKKHVFDGYLGNLFWLKSLSWKTQEREVGGGLVKLVLTFMRRREGVMQW